MPSVSFVVPIYPFDAYVLDMATRALDVARKNTPGAEIVAVHNGGLKKAKSLADHADIYIHLDPNQGYSPAVNAGLAAATGDILVVSSHDVFVRPGWLKPALRAIEKRGLGIAAPVINDPSWQKWTGAIWVMPRSTYETVGPLDEETFRYRCGDQDFAIRAHMAGIRIDYVPDSNFLHDRSGVRSMTLHEPGVVDRELQAMRDKYGADRYRKWLLVRREWTA